MNLKKLRMPDARAVLYEACLIALFVIRYWGYILGGLGFPVAFGAKQAG